ncbi:rod-determining factor RdfA [Haloprofundus halobius]|uniref:rod-determining factor RdfA n=1 Tax=Haloprofundus halobius TaxID=2876194 RepID=UPI001CCD7E4C|nr:rod-determining factor RdfA [Haloprofundus halobius]
MSQQRGVANESDSGCGCKVERVAERYELDRIDDALVTGWLGESGERYSLRRLETYLNERVLESAMAETTMTVLDGDVAHLYERLTDGSVSAGQRAETENYLKRAGINVERVRNDFVSHQTVHTHLRNCLGTTRKRTQNTESRVEKADQTVRALQNRMRLVTGGTVERLTRAGAVSIDSFDVYVETTIVCRDCDRSASFSELLERGGCRCRVDTERGGVEELGGETAIRAER